MAEQIAQALKGVQAERERGALPDSMPMVLRSAVHITMLSKGRFRQPWSKRLVLIKWVVTGEAAFRIRGRRYAFGPGDVAVYMPSVPHEMWAVADVSEMCWFSMDGPLCEQFAHMLGLRAGVYHYGDPPVKQSRRTDRIARRPLPRRPIAIPASWRCSCNTRSPPGCLCSRFPHPGPAGPASGAGRIGRLRIYPPRKSRKNSNTIAAP